MFPISIADVKKLAPHANGEYIAAFIDADTILERYKIDNRLRICHFFAQILAETGGFRVFVESLYYSAPRLMQVWPKHFPTIEAAEPYAHNEKALGNFIYGAKIHPDLGNTEPGDGYRFRGRGLLQITGRYAYKRYGDLLGVSFLDEPDLVYDHRYSLSVASAEFSLSKHNGQSALALSDNDDVIGVTYAVNGGQIGIDQRRLWLSRSKQIFGNDGNEQLIAEIAVNGSSRAVANAWRATPA